MKTIKNYSEFVDWLTSRGLDCEYDTIETFNDRIIIFNPDGSLNDDTTFYRTKNPPKSWNVLKTKIERIIKKGD